MSDILIDISGSIEPERVAVLGSIQSVAQELGIHFIAVGAFARDLIFEHIHRIPAPRLTEDIDIGVEVASWDEFHRLTSILVERSLFAATALPHRFTGVTSATIVDIVPYGGVSDEMKRISWPPDHDMIMSMLGFEEAYQSALTVRISSEPLLEVLVPSIPALALMKIISWHDAYPSRERDAQDLFFIMENCGNAGIEDELYSLHTSLLIEEKFDPQLASVRYLGRAIARLAHSQTLQAVEEILICETDEHRGVRGAMRQGTRFENALQLLGKILQGIQEEQSKM
jgi:predicted nucleotidyltransferase